MNHWHCLKMTHIVMSRRYSAVNSYPQNNHRLNKIIIRLIVCDREVVAPITASEPLNLHSRQASTSVGKIKLLRGMFSFINL